MLSLLGETINVMTLGGLALAVGILVDDATVTIENINWHLEHGKEIESAIKSEAGMLLACGPTGSGKTTTLYAAVRSIDSNQRNVVTIEDPVEIPIEGITQIPVNDSQGNTFPILLR